MIAEITNRAKILIADDDEAVRFLLGDELSSLGYEVETVSDGDEAIELLKMRRFDVVLLDIKMKRVDGFDVLKYVKANSPETRVIMLTAYGDVRNAIESLHLGASDLISKPYDLDDVIATIERTLNR
ncbi:MAG: response regulator [Bacteroidota bacterium]